LRAGWVAAIVADISQCVTLRIVISRCVSLPSVQLLPAVLLTRQFGLGLLNLSLDAFVRAPA